MQRLPRFQNVPDSSWTDWRWQLRNRLANGADLRDFFPRIGPEERECFARYTAKYRLGITPYTLTLIELDASGNPAPGDPIWRQFRYLSADDDYDSRQRNWERTEEMPTRILQHKYPDRAIIRLVDQCFGYCSYCYLATRTLDLAAASPAREEWARVWGETLRYLKEHPEIRDVLISGGEPLLFTNEKLAAVMADLRSISSIKTLRLNTRALTFNPFRFDHELAQICKEYALTALEIHTAHPRELTEEFDSALAHFDIVGWRPVILWRTPLLRGINDTRAVLEDLLLKLYQRRIYPYYIFHYAPFTLGRAEYGVDIRAGCRLLSRIRRAVPGPAFPRYTLFHVEGKQDIPLDPEGTPDFRYENDAAGRPIVTFRNWRGQWVSYPDVAVAAAEEAAAGGETQNEV